MRTYQQYLLNYKQLVGFCGDVRLYDYTIEKLIEYEQGLGPNFKIDKYGQGKLDFPKPTPSTLRKDSGVIKYNWIEKITNKIPSVLVFVYNLIPLLSEQETWEKRVALFQREFQEVTSSLQHFKKLRVRIIVVMFSGKNVQMLQGAEQAIQSIKKRVDSDIDSKRFFMIPGDKDAVGGYIKKYLIIKSQIIEDSKNFYEEVYRRCKNDNKKLTNKFCDQKLKLDLKESFISEIQNEFKRAKKHYDVAYQTVISLSDNYKEQIRYSFSDPGRDSLLNNYEVILKGEEYRTIADVIKLRQIMLMSQDANSIEIINQFETHFNYFKKFVDHRYADLDFEESKWRSEFTYTFIKLFQSIQSKRANFLTDYAYITKFQNLIQSSALYYLRRDDLVLRDREFSLSPNLNIKKVEPLYLGRANYNEYQQQETRVSLHVIKERWQWESKYRDQGLTILQELLGTWESLLSGAHGGTRIYIAYLKACIHAKKSTQIFNNYIVETPQLTLVIDYIKYDLIKYGMLRELSYLMKLLEGILLSSSEMFFDKIIQLNFELIFYKQKTEPLSTIDKIFNLSEHLTKDFQCLTQVLVETKWINVQVLVKSKFFNPKLETKLKIRLEAFLQLGELFQEALLTFSTDQFEKIQISEFTEDSFTQFIRSYTLTLPAGYFKSDQVCIKSIHLSGVRRNKAEKKFSYSIQLDHIPLWQEHKDITKSLIKFIQIQEPKVPEQHNESTIAKVNQKVKDTNIQDDNPLIFKLQCKSFNSLYKNKLCQKNNQYIHQKIMVPAFSKCSLLIKIASTQDIWIHAINLEPSQDSLEAGVKFFNSTTFTQPKQLVAQEELQVQQIFTTQGTKNVKQMCCFTVSWSRDPANNKTLHTQRLPIYELEIQQSQFDLHIEVPLSVRFQEIFHFEVNIENKKDENVNLLISLKEGQGAEVKKQFLVVGMVRQQLNLLARQSHRLQFQLLPIDYGTCQLPGILIEQRNPNTQPQILFDTTGMKQIVVIP